MNGVQMNFNPKKIKSLHLNATGRASDLMHSVLGQRFMQKVMSILNPWLKRLPLPRHEDANVDLAGSGMDRVVTRKRSWKDFAPFVAGAFFLIIAIWILAGMGGTVYRVPADQLTISTVSRGAFEDYAAVQGAVAPFTTVYLTTAQGGSVAEVLVEDGTMVKAGQPLIRLTNPELQKQYAQSELDTARQSSDLQNTQLQLEQSRFKTQSDLLDIEYQLSSLKSDIERDKRLLAAGALARATYEKDQAKYSYQTKLHAATRATFHTASRIRTAQLETLKKTQEELKANLAAAKQSIDDLTIRAPMAGQLTALDAKNGQSKAAGAVLGQVDSLNRFKLTANVDEFYLGRVRRGQRAILTMDSANYTAEVAKIYPQVKDGTFKVDLYFTGKAPDGIHTGQTVDFKLQLGGAEQAILLPVGSFYQDTGGTWAFVLSKNGHTATKRNIRIGRRNPAYLEVLEGLKPGDQVITSAYTAFKNVDEVKIKS